MRTGVKKLNSEIINQRSRGMLLNLTREMQDDRIDRNRKKTCRENLNRREVNKRRRFYEWMDIIKPIVPFDGWKWTEISNNECSTAESKRGCLS